MLDLLLRGDIIFTGPQTALGLVVLFLSVKQAVELYTRPDLPAADHKKLLAPILQVGIFTFFFGILGQAVGILSALQAIKRAGNIELRILLGGIQEMMIAPVYGLVIFLVSLVSWSILRHRYEQLHPSA